MEEEEVVSGSKMVQGECASARDEVDIRRAVCSVHCAVGSGQWADEGWASRDCAGE